MKKLVLALCFVASVLVGGFLFYRGLFQNVELPGVGVTMLLDTLAGLLLGVAFFTLTELLSFPESCSPRTRRSLNLIVAALVVGLATTSLLTLHTEELKTFTKFAVGEIRRTEESAKNRAKAIKKTRRKKEAAESPADPAAKDQ